jgi:hypothetical protein
MHTRAFWQDGAHASHASSYASHECVAPAIKHIASRGFAACLAEQVTSRTVHMLISHRQPAHPHVGTYCTYAGLTEFSTELYCRAAGARRLDPASERQGMAICELWSALAAFRVML